MGTSIALSGPYRKAAWAEKRRIVLQAELDAALFPEGGPDQLEIGTEFDASSNTVLMKVERAPGLPWYTGLMVGDVLHNLRSALDHTAWALVKAGAKPNPKAPHRVAFPIYDDPAEFTSQLSSMLPGVPEEQRAIIESVQPYHESEVPAALAILRKMSNDGWTVPSLPELVPEMDSEPDRQQPALHDHDRRRDMD